MTIQEILEAHQIGYAYADIHGLRKQGCTGCDFRIEGQASEIGNMREIHRAHLAEVLGKHMQEREAAVIESLADELGEYQAAHDVAECAAPVEGEVGRQACIDRWIEITEDPESWLREKSVEHHANGFEYLRYVAYEAWQAGYDAGEICASGALDKDHECETNPYADEEPTNGR